MHTPAGEQMHDREGPFAQAAKGARALASGRAIGFEIGSGARPLGPGSRR